MRQRRYVVARLGAPHPETGTWTAERARREALRLLGTIRAGADPIAERDAARTARRPRTVAELAAEWLAKDRAANRSLPETRCILAAHVLPAIGPLPASDIRKADLLALLEALAERAPVQANRVLGRVRRLFRWSLPREPVEREPTAGLEPLAVDRPRARARRARAPARPARGRAARLALRTVVRLPVATGCRRAEIGGPVWPELRLGGPEPAVLLAAERTETASGRIVPVAPLALEVRRTLPTQAGPHLFGRRGARPFQGWSNGKEALDRAVAEFAGEPLPSWTVHDRRRSVSTGLQRFGARLETIETVLGHVSGSRRGIVAVYRRHDFPRASRAKADVGREVAELRARIERETLAAAALATVRPRCASVEDEDRAAAAPIRAYQRQMPLGQRLTRPGRRPNRRQARHPTKPAFLVAKSAFLVAM